MMVMTAKVDFKKVLLGLVAAVALIVALVLLFGNGNEEATPTGSTAMSSNDARVQFLKDFGWDVTTSPTESSQVKIPENTSEVFDRYNTLQKQQGYDLTPYAGKSVMRYVYKINNFPGATEPVYATLLVYKNKIIGGDITDTSAKGVIQGFKMPTGTTTAPSAPTSPTAPTESSAPATDPE